MSLPTFTYEAALQATTSWEAAPGLRASRLEVSKQVREGLPLLAFEPFSRASSLAREALAKLAERLVRLATLYARAGEVIGDTHLARQWIQTPRETFGGMTPLLMAATELGAREVEHGVFY